MGIVKNSTKIILFLLLLLFLTCKKEKNENFFSVGNNFLFNITAFPPDADVSLIMNDGTLMSNTPAKLSLNENPKQIILSRKGYLETVINKIESKKIHIDLVPDKKQAEILFAKINSIDMLIEYLFLYPTIINTEFYQKLQSLIIDKSKTTDSLEIENITGPILVEKDNISMILHYENPENYDKDFNLNIFAPKISMSQPNPNMYALYFLDPIKFPLLVFKRHFKNLISLEYTYNEDIIYIIETSLASLLESSCDCFQFKISVYYSISNSHFHFQKIIYREIEKNGRNRNTFKLIKDIQNK